MNSILTPERIAEVRDAHAQFGDTGRIQLTTGEFLAIIDDLAAARAEVKTLREAAIEMQNALMMNWKYPRNKRYKDRTVTAITGVGKALASTAAEGEG